MVHSTVTAVQNDLLRTSLWLIKIVYGLSWTSSSSVLIAGVSLNRGQSSFLLVNVIKTLSWVSNELADRHRAVQRLKNAANSRHLFCWAFTDAINQLQNSSELFAAGAVRYYAWTGRRRRTLVTNNKVSATMWIISRWHFVFKFPIFKSDFRWTYLLNKWSSCMVDFFVIVDKESSMPMCHVSSVWE